MSGAEFRPSTFIPQEELFIESENERIQSNCGLFAAIDVDGSLTGDRLRDITIRGGRKLQHRAEDAAGYYVFDSMGHGHSVKGKDKIEIAFQNGALVPRVPDGKIAIIHTRYATSGDPDSDQNIQPLELGGITLAHHGNLTNAREVKNKLGDINWGGEFPNNDTWVALNAIVRSDGETLEEKMVNAQKDFEGGWAFVATDGKGIVASRDPEGIRPLFLGVEGSWENPKSYALSVEDSAFRIDGLDIELDREVLPGETISIRDRRVETVDINTSPDQRSCIFEIVYMMDPDSKFMGHNVAMARIKAGKLLWQEHPLFLEDDLLTIMPVPDSGRDYEAGFFGEALKANRGKLDRVEGIKKRRYGSRSFIQPSGKRNPKESFIIIRELIEGRNILLIDDSLVRGNTMGGEAGVEGLVSRLRKAGARQVHLRNGAPPVVNGCHWGVDFPTREELSAHNYPDENERAKVLGLDSLGYLSLDNLYQAVGADNKTWENFCAYCFGGNGPKYIPRNEGEGTVGLIEHSLLEIKS